MKEEKKMNIYQKISKIMEEIEYLQKDDKVITNTQKNTGYKAISEEKVTAEVRKAMVKHGVVIIPIEQTHRREDDEPMVNSFGNRTVSRLTTVDVKYRIQNIDDIEDYVIASSSGTGVDTQDKGVGKAMTYSYKYLLLRTFAIPTGEDPDKISSEEYDNQLNKKGKTKKKEETVNYRQKLIDYCNENGLDMNEIAKKHKLNAKTTQEYFKKVLEELTNE